MYCHCTEIGIVLSVYVVFLGGDKPNLTYDLLQAPEIVVLYALNVSPAYVRHSIRQRFDRNRNVTDLRAINVLLLKGRQEYQETLNGWKQTDHVAGILLQPQDRPQKTFLQKFYEGELCVRTFNFYG